MLGYVRLDPICPVILVYEVVGSVEVRGIHISDRTVITSMIGIIPDQSLFFICIFFLSISFESFFVQEEDFFE